MHIRKLAAALALGVAAFAIGGQIAGAAPIDDKRAQAAKVQADIDAAGERLSDLGEKLKGARLRLAQADRQLAEAKTNLAAAEAHAGQLRGALAGRAAELLKLNASGALASGDEVDLSQMEDAAQRAKYAQLSNDRDRSSLNNLAYVQEDLAVKRKNLSDVQAQRKAAADAIASQQSAMKKAEADLKKKLASIQADIRKLMEEEQARQRANARTRVGGGRWGDPGMAMPTVTSPNAIARRAIAFAQSQLGKPYVYAAAGPDAYDCSGLTMMAYAAAGVEMGHYSGSQYASFPHVPLDSMLPGDLIFWGGGGSQHVGLYIGNGLMIDAPHTGAWVHVTQVYGGAYGAARPWSN